MQKGVAPILIVLLVAILGIGGYFAYTSLRGSSTRNGAGDVAISPSPAPIVNSIPTSSAASPVPNGAAETANWKTYTNTKYKFSFKYPEAVSINMDTDNINANKLVGYLVGISGNGLDLVVNFDLNSSPDSMFKSSEKYTVNGKTWTVLFSNPKGNCPAGLGPCVPTLNYQIIDNDHLVTLTFRGDYPNREIPIKILSTFKFTDQNQTNALVPADSQTSASGICPGPTSDSVVTITFLFNGDKVYSVANPRCTKVTSNQKLKIVNNSTQTISGTISQYTINIPSKQSQMIDATFGSYLTPGVHNIVGAEIWLQ